jgi:diguanylate cyclase (GGDEF)-like protein/PAS domain S-box-containing protein
MRGASMSDPRASEFAWGEHALKIEITRLRSIIEALLDGAGAGTSVRGSDNSRPPSSTMLDERVRARTAELEAALAENVKINRALAESEAKFRGIVDQSLVGIVISVDGMFTYTNARFDEMSGYTAEEALRLGPLDITVEEDRRLVEESIRQRVSGERRSTTYRFRGLRKDGSVMDLESHGSLMEIDGKRSVISLLLDVTERVRAERELRALQEKLHQQSTRDSLTGLYNRRYLDSVLERELIRAAREDYPVSAIMADLDHFKTVNDRHGHLAGDEVLRTFGDLMKGHAREADVYCRYGGEEFLLILPGMARDTAFQRAEQLRCAMAAAPVVFGVTAIRVTASFGVATFPYTGASADELIHTADRALYAAKAAGRNRVAVSAGSRLFASRP